MQAPENLVTAKVTWSIGHTRRTGKPVLTGARGHVIFTPTAVAVAYRGATVLPAQERAEVVDGVMAPLQLEVNDPEVWNWRVEPSVGVAWEPFHIDVPPAGLDVASAVVVPGIGPLRAVQGKQGVGVVDAVDQGDGTVRYVLSDGSMTQPVELPTGPAGPATTLTIGTVTKGDTPALTLTGTAPHQVLSAVLPKGDKGDPGRDGVDSTVPGPQGKEGEQGPRGITAWEYAVMGGYTGTEEEYAAAATPTAVDWSQITGTPAEYTPAAHTHEQSDVTGLAATIAGLVSTTDPRLTDARTPVAHKHAVSDVTGLQTALDGKVPTTDPRLTDTRTPTAHTHAVADVTGLVDTLAGKASTTDPRFPTDTGWSATGLTFYSGWSMPTDRYANWYPLRYRVLNGICYVNGILNKSSASIQGETMIVLPPEARPKRYFNSPRGDAHSTGAITCPEAGVTTVAVEMSFPIG